jgi:hypothetical protein
MIPAPYSRPLGIADLVRRHGDTWMYEGINFAHRIHDDRLRKAYLSLLQPNSSDVTDGHKMYFYTKRIYSRPINDVRGRP